MKKIIGLALILFSFILLSQQIPNIPKPKFDNITVNASVDEVILDDYPAYKFTYYVANPESNDVRIDYIEVLLQSGYVFDLFEQEGWIGDCGQNITHSPEVPLDTVAFFGGSEWPIPAHPEDPDNEEVIGIRLGENPPLPGTTSGPMGFYAWDYQPPVITDAWITPNVGKYLVALYDWYEANNIPEKDIPHEADVIASFIKKIPTLCPLPPYISYGSFEHWDRLISDTEKALQIGWFLDQNLHSQILQKLREGRSALENGNEVVAHQKLDEVINLISSATSSQLKREGKDLVYLNAKVLNQYTPWPYEPKLTLSISAEKLSLGETLILTAKLENIALHKPIPNEKVGYEILEGPDEGMGCWEYTGEDGIATFEITGYYEGRDKIVAYILNGEEGIFSLPVEILWEGAPDLKLNLFVPSSIEVNPGETFFISDTVINVGSLPSPPSVIYYYLGESEDEQNYFAERPIPALQPNEMNSVINIPYLLPTNMNIGKHYLSACVDPEDLIAELNEYNNCSYDNLWSQAGILPISIPQNLPPDCSKAKANVDKLWPPNHKLENISIQGITDPENDPFTITVTSITQDEPTNGLGDGDTSPDGFGVGTSNPQIRAERSGKGNGRVYQINFKAVDSKGAECNGSVKVGVPHDKKDTPIDDGQNYDSTKP